MTRLWDNTLGSGKRDMMSYLGHKEEVRSRAPQADRPRWAQPVPSGSWVRTEVQGFRKEICPLKAGILLVCSCVRPSFWFAFHPGVSEVQGRFLFRFSISLSNSSPRKCSTHPWAQCESLSVCVLAVNCGHLGCSLSAWFGMPSTQSAVFQCSHPVSRESGFYLCPPGPFLALLRRPALPWMWWHPASLTPPPVTAFSPSQSTVLPDRNLRRAGQSTEKLTLPGHPPCHMPQLAPCRPAVTCWVAVGTSLAHGFGSLTDTLPVGVLRGGMDWRGRSTRCLQTCPSPSASASGMLLTAMVPGHSALAEWKWRGYLDVNAGEK